MVITELNWANQILHIGTIGRKGENGTRQLSWQCNGVLQEYPTASIIAIVQRPQGDPYSVALETSETKRRMTIGSADVEYIGTVRIELRVIVDQKVRKSAVYLGDVEASITGEGDAPGQPVRDVLDRVEAELTGLQSMSAEASTLEPGSAATATYNPTTKKFAFGVPRGAQGPQGDTGETGATGPAGADGEDGEDGVSPTVSITQITGGHRITITDADGSHSADVMDGTDATVTRSAIVSALGAGSPNLSANDYSAAEKAQVAANASAITSLNQALVNKANASDTGNKYDLHTTSKTTLVSAINEIADNYLSKKTITVTCVTQDGVLVTGQTVTLREGDSATSPVSQTASYNGAAVTFEVPTGFPYFISVSNTLAQHFNPSTASGQANENKTIILTYEDVSSISTFIGIAEAVAAGAGDALVGKEIEDTWIDENGTSYSDPMICSSVETVTDANGVNHTAAIMQRKWAMLREIQFSAPQQQEATELTAQDGITYYGLTGSSVTAANITKLALNAGDAIPYGDYTKVFRNAINDSSKNICQYGYSRWSHSVYRQYLNSNANVCAWWTAQHEGDCAPSNINSVRGYMAGCSAALLAAAKPIKVPCYLNTVTDGGIIEETVDTFWLPSGNQLYGNVNANEGSYWKRYKDLCPSDWTAAKNDACEGRIHYSISNHLSARSGRVRSADRGSSYIVWSCSAAGYIGTTNAYNAYASEPACAIY